MSNVLRVQLKKLGRNKANKSKSTVNVGTPSAVEKGKKKALSVSSPPEGSPNHQYISHQMSPRKSSLSADSPSHGVRTPTSPLVTKSSSMANMTPRRDSNSAPLSSTAPSSTAPTPTSSLPLVPKVSIHSDDAQSLDRQGIIDITVDVQNFLAAISRLKQAMEEAEGVDTNSMAGGEDERESQSSSPSTPPSYSADVIRSNLSDLIQIVTSCLDQHTGMQSTVIKDAAKNLTDCYQTCNHTNAASCTDCNGAIDHLIDAFTNSVSEYLTGDTVDSNLPSLQHRSGGTGGGHSGGKLGLSASGLKGFSKSQDNLAKFGSVVDLSQHFNDPIVDQIDQALMGIEHSVEVATRYLKMRLKYHKEIVSYLSKRAQIESRYYQDLAKLGKRTHLNLDDLGGEDCLPLMDLFKTSIDQDTRFASNCNTTYNFQVERKLIEPLEHKMAECEKMKKELTSTWHKQLKKLNEAKTSMKNAKSKYRFLGQDLSRVKNLLAMDPYGKQADKRKKEVSDLEARWQEAETAYKNAVAVCNECQYQVHVSAQKSILCAFRRQVMEFDIQLRDGLDTYFTLQHNFFKTLPEPMSRNIDDVRDYEVGQEFMRYILGHPEAKDEPEDYLFEEFDPEAEAINDSPDVVFDSKGLPNSNSAESNFLSAAEDHIPRRAPSPQPVHHAWEGIGFESKRLSSGSTPSPRANKKRARPRSMAFLLEPNQTFEPIKKETGQPVQRRNSDQHSHDPAHSPPQILYPDEPLMSKNAITHTFKKLRGPARCRECDNYVYFHGHECEVCGLACHKKCLATLAIRCGNKRLARKMTTFGVDFQKHLKASKRNIPIIVTKCINEIDERGLDTQGLYRISSAKTKLEHLCQLFESGIDRVDLSDRPAHLVGSCLKLYFRQLPEPLLTFDLYQEFITFAREASHILPCKFDSVSEEKAEMARGLIERLKGLIQKLPYQNYITLARLLFHLNRVGAPEHVKHNCMPPSNLGIVFGPNLLKQRDMVASLALLADMTAQAKAIEILISHAHDVFHMSEDRIRDEMEVECDESEMKEVLVDEPLSLMQSPQLDIDDATTAGSRTPFNTPPERRRENVFELGDILEALQSVGRRNSQPSIGSHKPHLSETRDLPNFTSMPAFSNIPPDISGSLEHSASDDTLTALSRYLRPSPNPIPLEKMLTPVEERPAAEYEREHSSLSDEDQDIVPTSSDKLDSNIFSRSFSGLSDPPTWLVGDLDTDRNSNRDSTSILSSGYGTPPRPILNSTNSMDNAEISQAQNMEDLAKALENHDEKGSSQGSDDSSTFSESVHYHNRGSNFNTVASPQGSGSFSFSSAEGTPVRTMSETRKRDPSRTQAEPRKHLVSSVSDSTTSRNARPRSSPHSSTRSSVSGTTLSSQSSLGEEGTSSSDASDKRSKLQKKYAKYDKYERYEKRERSQSFDASPERKRDNIVELPSDNEPPQRLTQDSNGTLTDGNLDTATETLTEVELSSSHSVTSSTDSFYQNMNGQISTVGNVKEQHLESPEHDQTQDNGEMEKDREGVSDLMRDVHKTLDSGIDDTNSPANKSIEPPRGSSVCDDDDGSKPPSYKLMFTSRDSMLTDSPDTDSLNDDYVNTKTSLVLVQQAYKPAGQQNKSLLSLERQLRATSEESEPSTGSPAHVELIIEDGKPARLYEHKPQPISLSNDEDLDCLLRVSDVDNDEDSVHELERSGSMATPTAPRSLEGPTFSRCARIPIRSTESKSHVRAATNPLYDTGSNLRQRACSLNDLDEIPPSPQPSREEDEQVARNRRAISESRTQKSLTASLPRSTKRSSNSGGAAAGGVGGLQQSTSATDLLASGADLLKGGSLRLEKKSKKGKGFVNKLKPALRVFKITPSSSVESKKTYRKELPIEKAYLQEVESRDSDHLIPRPYEEVRRMRMMSPEVMLIQDAPPTSMRRSHSSDDILDCSTDNLTDISVEPTNLKVGPVYVIPEATKPKRRRFLGFPHKKSLSKDSNKSRESSKSPVVLVGVRPRTRRVSVEPILNPTANSNGNGPLEAISQQKSPKSKRRRLPHFV